MSFKFPDFKQVYPNLSERGILKQLLVYTRHHLRYYLAHDEVNQFEKYLNKNPIWINIFEQNLYRVDALLTKYCNNQFNAKQRLAAIIEHFEITKKYFPLPLLEVLIHQEEIIICALTEKLTLKLALNKIDPFEGFFAIYIEDEQHNHLYDASFSFISPNQCLIASIQGPKGKYAQETVRDLTKQLYGIRPMFMIVNVFKILSQMLELKLLGIPHKYQAKYRWNDSRRLMFNYDIFWQENNAERVGNYWHIPIKIERKTLEEIQSKKRSMYRKRYEMLDHLQKAIHTQWDSYK